MDRPTARRRRARPRRPGGDLADAQPPRPRAASGRAAPGAEPTRAELCTLSPFSAFCAAHLGITATDGFARPSLAAAAERFGMSRDELAAYLEEERLCSGALRAAGFDLPGAVLDMRVAPDGISRTELARTHFEDLRRVQKEASAVR